jgi:hypothetical protein
VWLGTRNGWGARAGQAKGNFEAKYGEICEMSGIFDEIRWPGRASLPKMELSGIGGITGVF